LTRRDLILIADDDEDIARFVEVNLRLEGFDVALAGNGEQALQTAFDTVPDLVLLDVMMPKLDGYQVVERLRRDPRTRHISVVMLTAKSLLADKVVGLTRGADDYIIKPFDPVELVARVKSALRRSREMRDVNPLTRLPGNVQVQERVIELVETGSDFALMYVDLDNFKSFNDYYGFLRGDEAIKLLAKCVGETVRTYCADDAFVGHVGGDDFVTIAPPQRGEVIAKDICDRWDRSIVELYDPEDVARGFIVVADRRSRVHHFPLVTVSIGIATTARRPITSHWEASEIASEMKQVAKRQAGSSYAVDRRQGTATEVAAVATSDAPGKAENLPT
jgi:PleD family two-component response regulator